MQTDAENVTPPNLSRLHLKLSYRTGRDDLVHDFLVPCLESSTVYRRAAGYFTSFGLALAARGIASLATRGGKMQLVVSPQLDPADVAVLQQAGANPVAALRAIAARNLADIEDALIKDRLNALAWLAASGLLEIKLAMRYDSNGVATRGIFHEKAGIFSDDLGHYVSFAGSSNETAGGLLENFESIKVFCSWSDGEGRVQEEIDNFEALWNNATPGLKVMEFTAVSRELLERYRDLSKPLPNLNAPLIHKPSPPIGFAPPANFDLRSYQADAIRAWSKAGGQGILAMATGSGKTLTALTLASKVAEKNKPFILIVVCPFINLCKQWIREMAPFGLDPIAAFDGRDRWQVLLEEGFQSVSLGLHQVLAIVTTNATFMGEAFQSRLRLRVDSRAYHHLLIADEVHNLGAPGIKEILPAGISMRLGLSATPERHHDPIGTKAVVDYFGGIVFQYTLDQAIADGRLCPYRYHPIVVSLTDEETTEYAEISAKLAKMMHGADLDEDLEAGVMRLLIKRARLLGAAVNKIDALDRLIASMPERPSKAIFYCGDGRTTDSITNDEVRQIQAVARLLGEKHGLRVRNFTYRETPQEREEILRDLSSGFLDGVVAIRCLDEGIDLPDLRMGFLLASSTNPRQFVQRRGRLLRNSSGKQRAEIYDFIVSPPDFGGAEDAASFNMERSFFKRELSRISEFCRMAENGVASIGSLRQLRLQYNLLTN